MDIFENAEIRDVIPRRTATGGEELINGDGSEEKRR
jgi:hypothetical protein